MKTNGNGKKAKVAFKTRGKVVKHTNKTSLKEDLSKRLETLNNDTEHGNRIKKRLEKRIEKL